MDLELERKTQLDCENAHLPETHFNCQNLTIYSNFQGFSKIRCGLLPFG
jgi:hypothetical protein